ncbi:TonB-dependent receptor [Lysobacter enzymogenes]|uniref:TonB-dependent receptor n=1 Tax=Lysobacter enzymogenes TaxID=69 RepID=A0A0S2DIT7_LYSEN|nr:TonB-dependent receptor [Lysobacter enzymogenes]ALN58555.1 TonB-dependent receptor [Lysobacter enzymogenes]QCW26906.1 TonB-dependent receptor [Lysobacter enzymogenes]QQQ03172.1 TonB-dependent receptor [Lysobacter enzymogenes]UZW62651.1 TonB-dependent receptor [Lysobacter enzymogenes]
MIARSPGRKTLSFAVALSLAASAAAHAQQSAPAQEDEAKTLAGLTVTAQKREEAMQDVPISITALPEQLLQDTGVRDIKDVQLLVPGLTVSSTQSEVQTVARIRGIGTVGDNAGLESSVGVVVDGVYRPRNGVGFGDLGEIERIEVLKGPQGTVFGKNTSAGVINVITRRPDYNTKVEGELTIGDYGAVGAAGSFNTALGENAAFRIYGAKRKRDGFTDVEVGRGPRAEREDGDQNFHTLRGQLLFEPTENLDINLIADFSSREENCCVGLTTVRGPTAAIVNALAGGTGVAPVADPFARRAWSNRPTTQDIKDKGVSAEINWITPWFGGATLTSITAARDWQAINGLDFDFSTADMIYRNADPDESFTGFKQFSQELRLTGSTDKLDWMVGLFYADEDLKRNDSYSLGAAYEPYLSTAVLSQIAARFPAGVVNTANAATFLSQASGRPFGTAFTGLGALDRYKQNSTSVALFTNNTWHVTDQLDLTLGLRYTKENKELDSVYSNPNGGVGCGAGLANPARVGQALAARGVPLAAINALVPQVLGFMCLPWANTLHNGRATHQERDEKEWSGTFKAAYRWNEHVMGYASAARGYKAGGFNLDRVQSSNGLSAGTAGITPVNDTSFPGEFVDSYELGAKTTWAGGNLLLNATLFHQTYSDFQLNSFLGTSFVVRSIPEVVSQGIDTEVLWQTGIKGLMLQGGVMYADTKYGNDPLPDADLAKLPGARASFAPLWSASAAVTYQWDFGPDLVGRFNIGAKYSSDYNTGSDLDPEKGQEAYTVVNARLGVGAKNRRWMVEAWAMNLFDEEYKQVGFDAPLQTGSWNAFLGAPRTYGVTLRVSY